MSRRTLLTLVLALFTFSATAVPAMAAAKKKAPKVSRVVGVSSCAECDGVTAGGHQIMIKAANGGRWVLNGSGPMYDEAKAVRKSGKKMVVTYSGKPTIKKDKAGKEYAEVEVSDIKVEG